MLRNNFRQGIKVFVRDSHIETNFICLLKQSKIFQKPWSLVRRTPKFNLLNVAKFLWGTE